MQRIISLSRPETAQGIFVNFLKHTEDRPDENFGIAQIGQAFRNGLWQDNSSSACGSWTDINAVLHPGTRRNGMSNGNKTWIEWHTGWGIPLESLELATMRCHAMNLGWWWNGTGTDIRSRQRSQTMKSWYFDNDIDPATANLTVITSPMLGNLIGLDRMFPCRHRVMLYEEQDLGDQQTNRTLEAVKLRLNLPPIGGPMCRWPRRWFTEIGRTYQRQIAARISAASMKKDSACRNGLRWTPFCVTVDHQTLTDDHCYHPPPGSMGAGGGYRSVK